MPEEHIRAAPTARASVPYWDLLVEANFTDEASDVTHIDWLHIDDCELSPVLGCLGSDFLLYRPHVITFSAPGGDAQVHLLDQLLYAPLDESVHHAGNNKGCPKSWTMWNNTLSSAPAMPGFSLIQPEADRPVRSLIPNGEVGDHGCRVAVKIELSTDAESLDRLSLIQLATLRTALRSIGISRQGGDGTLSDKDLLRIEVTVLHTYAALGEEAQVYRFKSPLPDPTHRQTGLPCEHISLDALVKVAVFKFNPVLDSENRTYFVSHCESVRTVLVDFLPRWNPAKMLKTCTAFEFEHLDEVPKDHSAITIAWRCKKGSQKNAAGSPGSIADLELFHRVLRRTFDRMFDRQGSALSNVPSLV